MAKRRSGNVDKRTEAKLFKSEESSGVAVAAKNPIADVAAWNPKADVAALDPIAAVAAWNLKVDVAALDPIAAVAAMSPIADVTAWNPKADVAALNPIAAAAAMNRVSAEIFNQPCIELAKSLLGKIIVRKIGESKDALVTLAGRIVETEAYLGSEDKACHSYNGKRTKRNLAMFMDPGTAYVYNIYGMYQCFNISSAGDGAVTLIRAVEPLLGMELMTTHRQSRIRKDQTQKVLKMKELGNGPSKLCQALVINKSLNCHDLRTSDEFFIAGDGFQVAESDIMAKARVGLGDFGEWTHKPLRFYLLNNQFVSVK